MSMASLRGPVRLTNPSCARFGFSITELLVASAIGITLMAAVATLLSVVGQAFSQSRSTVDMAARMRAAAWDLRQDLAGVTCPVVPWLTPDMNAGYFEYVEGQRRDAFAADGTGNLEADTDDILMFTTRSLEAPFVGRCNLKPQATQLIESPYAEVAWFCRAAAEQPVQGITLYNLYRRQLLVLGYVGVGNFELQSNNSIQGSLPDSYFDYDISLRLEDGRLYPNTLGDLTKRENRFRHSAAFPHHILVDSNGRLDDKATFDKAPLDKSERAWEDVILTNIISFDVRAYDPQARAQISAVDGVRVVRYPGDNGYTPPANGSPAAGAFGAYIDLGRGQGGRLSQSPDPKSRLTPLPGNARVYDTWSQHYEFTAPGRAGMNESSGYTTLAPYPVPLRAVEVRVRCYDPITKQVRQETVRQAFRGS
jgi:hypothetical protein